MDFMKLVKQTWEILILKEPTMRTVAKDPDALRPGLVILAISALVSSLGVFFFPPVVGLVTYRPSIMGVIAQTVFAVVFGIAWLYLMGHIAEHSFGSKLDKNGYVRVMARSNVVTVLGLFPLLNILAGAWSIVILAFVLTRIGKMQAGAIVLFFLLQILLFIVFAVVLSFVYGALGLSLLP